MQYIRHIVLGITGGVAAYKAAELTRSLVKRGISVQVVMTEAATQFITPVTMQALSGKPVFVSMWDSSIANGMPHIELSRQADLILIAPATADFMAKLAYGMSDDLLSTLCLARDCPLYVAPAMNKQMWEHSATQRNVKQLRQDKVQILGPDSGEQACGEVGQGRMLEPEAIVDALLQAHGVSTALLTNKRVLITAGPTVEAIDPVRVISNHSSGKMGYALASAATQLGAQVTLVSGPTHLQQPQVHRVIDVTSADEMLQAVMQVVAEQDIFISVAAVADYKPAHTSSEKIKKHNAELTLQLVPTTDILATVANSKQAPFCVGFAAETNQVLQYAEKKRLEKKLPLIVANEVTQVLGQDDTQVNLLDDQGTHPILAGSKMDVAFAILSHVAKMITK
jgi:phosphopantothenoylcysteine decarboxylase/phosphopantothenate--cysteine ligase